MKTTFTVGIRDLSCLLQSVMDNETEGSDDLLSVSHWILDALGAPPDSNHNWHNLSDDELSNCVDKKGFCLFCRDSMTDLVFEAMEGKRTAASVIVSWIDNIIEIETMRTFRANGRN